MCHVDKNSVSNNVVDLMNTFANPLFFDLFSEWVKVLYVFGRFLCIQFFLRKCGSLVFVMHF